MLLSLVCTCEMSSKSSSHEEFGIQIKRNDFSMSNAQNTTSVVLSVRMPFSDSSDIEYRMNRTLYENTALNERSENPSIKMIAVVPLEGNIFSPAPISGVHVVSFSKHIYTEMYQKFKHFLDAKTFSLGYYLVTFIGKKLNINPVIIVAATDLDAKNIAEDYFSKISPFLKHTKVTPPFSIFRFRDEPAHETISFTEDGDLVQKDLFFPVFSSAILSKKRSRSTTSSVEHKRKLVKIEAEPEVKAEQSLDVDMF